jgi:choline dehydrogenase-like flavoprotein
LTGVVNSDLKVYGTTNVRVVDASIIPLHIAANIQATVYAIAEKVGLRLTAGTCAVTQLSQILKIYQAAHMILNA